MEKTVWAALEAFEEAQQRKGLKPGTIAMKKSDLAKFFLYLEEDRPGKHFGTITTEDIRHYLDAFENVTGRPVTSYMYNRRVCYFKEFYDFLMEREEVLFNPAISLDYVPVTKGDHLGVFTEEEVKAILNALDESPIGRRDRAILELLYGSGLRLHELVQLDVEDIDFEEREIFIGHGKGNKERVVPAGEEALKALEGYLNERHRWMKPGRLPSEVEARERKALFLSAQGRRAAGACIQEMIKRRKEQAGVTSRGLTHAFRHSFATHLLSHGAPIQAIQRILGHEHLYTTQGYVHLLERDMRTMHKESHPKAGKEE